MRALTKTILLGFALLLTVHCSLLTVDAQSRTTRIYQRCGSQPLSPSPRTPAQVTISAVGDITVNPCYQKTFTINDPHNVSTEGFFWSSLTGTEIEGSLNIFSSDFKVYGGLGIGYTDATYTAPDFYINRTITAGGTTGNVTINKLSGTVNIAAGAGTAGVTVTNSTVTANSIVYAIARTNDTTCSVKNVVPASGSFVLRTTANCTAETSFGFLVTN